MGILLGLSALVFIMLAVGFRMALPEEKKHYSYLGLIVLFAVYAFLISLIEVERPQMPEMPTFPDRQVKSEFYVDIVDSRTDKDSVQIVVYEGKCIQRFQVKKKTLEDKEKLNELLDFVVKQNELKGGC